MNDMSSSVRGITILGSTGSIGLSTLDVVARHPERFRVIALSANSQVDRLFEQCHSFKPKYAVMANPDAAEQLKSKLKASGSETEVLSGVEGLEQAASLDEVDDVMAAIVGAAGLTPSIAAARAGKRILLAADAHSEVLEASLAPLAEGEGGRFRIDLLKVSQLTVLELIMLLHLHRLITHCSLNPVQKYIVGS